MPELYKTREQVPKISRLSLLKARIVDRIRRHKEKEQKQEKATVSASKETKKVVVKTVVTPDKKQPYSASKIVVKEASKVSVANKPTQQPKRPIDQILVGSWNAIKWLPEKQEKWLFKSVYEKFIYPRLTPEQQKKAKAMEPKIKQYAKVGGWVMTGGEVIVAGVIVKKVYEFIKQKRRKPIVNIVGDTPQRGGVHTRDLVSIASAGDMPSVSSADRKTIQNLEGALPDYLHNLLSRLGAALDKDIDIKDMPAWKIAALKNHILENVGVLVSQGAPPDVIEMLGKMKMAKGKDEIREAGIMAIVHWNAWLRDSGKKPLEMIEMMGVVRAFEASGFDALMNLDVKQLEKIQPNVVLPLLKQMFAITNFAPEASGVVRSALDVLKKHLNGPFSADTPFTDDRGMLQEMIPAVAAPFYQYLHTHGEVIREVNAFSSREDQGSHLRKVFTEFMEEFIKQLNPTEEQKGSAQLNMMIANMFLDTLGYPGLEELGIRLKPKPME